MTAIWFPLRDERKLPKIRLFCFPSAGAGAVSYRTWLGGLSPHIELVPVELPGRGGRFDEPPFHAWPPLVDAATQAIRPLLDLPFAFFGHSMGAKVAYAVTRALAEQGPLPSLLVVSASCAPHIKRQSAARSTFTDDALVAELRRLGGTPSGILESPDMLELFLPVVRADFELVDSFFVAKGSPVDVPLAAFAGTRDPEVPPRHVEAWESHTSRDFTFEEVDGGHFYLESARERIFERIRRAFPQLD